MISKIIKTQKKDPPKDFADLYYRIKALAFWLIGCVIAPLIVSFIWMFFHMYIQTQDNTKDIKRMDSTTVNIYNWDHLINIEYYYLDCVDKLNSCPYKGWLEHQKRKSDERGFSIQQNGIIQENKLLCKYIIQKPL